MKFNKKHLNHDFKSTGNKKLLINFICLVCNINGYYVNANGSYIVLPKYKELDLTCEEQQIKSLLE